MKDTSVTHENEQQLIDSTQDKVALYMELHKRKPDTDPRQFKQQFKQDVASGRFVQYCIKIESKGRKAESDEFLREYRLLGGDSGASIADMED